MLLFAFYGVTYLYWDLRFDPRILCTGENLLMKLNLNYIPDRDSRQRIKLIHTVYIYLRGIQIYVLMPWI